MTFFYSQLKQKKTKQKNKIESQVSGATYYKKENGGYYLTGPGFNVLTSDTVTPFLRAKGLQTEFDVIICTSNDPQNCQWMNKDGEIVSGVTMEEVDCPHSLIDSQLSTTHFFQPI